jgi:hypothetical protein
MGLATLGRCAGAARRAGQDTYSASDALPAKVRIAAAFRRISSAAGANTLNGGSGYTAPAIEQAAADAIENATHFPAADVAVSCLICDMPNL